MMLAEPMTRAEWDAIRRANREVRRAELREMAAMERIAQAYQARVAVEGPLAHLADVEGREVAVAEGVAPEPLTIGMYSPRFLLAGLACPRAWAAWGL